MSIIKKIILGVIVTCVGLFCLLNCLFILFLAMAPEKDDIAVFAHNKYLLGSPPSSYNLYKKSNGETILDNVTGYSVGRKNSST